LKLDLNLPEFQSDLFKLDKKDLFTLIKSFRLLKKNNFDHLKRSKGFNLEKLKNVKTRKGKAVYSIRLSKRFRALITVNNDFLQFISLHPDHNSAYS
jgi:hypothetical protein